MKSALSRRLLAFGFGLWALGWLFTAPLRAADKTTVGELITEPPTLLSLGFEWRIEGDDNRNAQVAVSYRKAGEQTWKTGPALLRIGNEDNCLEADGSAHNIRIFRNRCFNHGHRALSVQPMFGGPVYFIRNIVYHAPEGGAVKFTASSSGIVVWHNTLIAPVKPMLLAASNVHYRNNLILGKSETLETFAVETNTNYSSSDYNGFRPNEGAEFSFEWSTPPFAMRANFPGEPGKLSAQEQSKFEATTRERRRFKTLKEFSAATGQDPHSLLVDYDVFVEVTPPGPDPRTLYKPADFDFRPREGSAAVDAGVKLTGINDDFTGKAPDLGAYEVGSLYRTTGPR